MTQHDDVGSLCADREKAAERVRFARAEKIAAADYTGPVFCAGGPPSTSMVDDDGDDSDMHLTLAAFHEACAEAGVEPPAWVWACVTRPPRTRAEWVIESATEDDFEETPSIPQEHIAKLEAFLAEWWAASGVVSYDIDYKRAVILAPESASEVRDA